MAGIGSALVFFNQLVVSLLSSTDDDSVDRLNRIGMTWLYLGMAGVCGLEQIVGKPINCWVPPEYKEDYHTEFVDSLCWVTDLYVRPMDEPIPFVKEDRYTSMVVFHRWAFVFFLTQAFMFTVPRQIWRQFSKSSGTNLDKIIDMVQETAMLPYDERCEMLDNIVKYLDQWIKTRSLTLKDEDEGRFQRARSRIQSLACRKKSGRQIILYYIFTKFLYVLNSIGQIFIIAFVLKMDFGTLGFSAMKSLVSDTPWEDHYNFPRMAHCDLVIRQQNNVNTFTVQCVISINLFLEKMFLISWFCIMIVSVVNCVSLMFWLFHYFSDNILAKFLNKYSVLVYSGYDVKKLGDPKLFAKVVKKYLRPDGVFILRMVARNTDDMVTADLIRQIISCFDEELKKKMERKVDKERLQKKT